MTTEGQGYELPSYEERLREVKDKLPDKSLQLKVLAIAATQIIRLES
jgi:hypothetical protein